MASNKITRRWILNSFVTILLILISVIIISSIAIRSFFYSSVRSEILSRSSVHTTLLETYAANSPADYSNEVRGLVEGFEDKDKMELMAISPDGRVVITSSGFAPPDNMFMPDFESAMLAGERTGETRYSLNGENVLAVTVLSTVSSEEIAALRYAVSLNKIDQQIILFISLITVICLCILLFVITTSSYFINSIVLPVGKVGETARRIAQGDFNVRLKKQNDDEIGELCDTINDMAEELSQSEKMKNDFISSVSHELRTPLTAIKGWAETLSTDEGTDPALLYKGMHVIISETERLSQMVEELLDFSRIQSGRFHLVKDHLDIIAELSDAVLMFTERIKREQMTLIYHEPDDLAMVYGDRNRLRQVFINIIDNAIKYSNPGDTITIEVGISPGRVIISIQDTGCGISEADLPKIKAKFYKANSTRRGSGIGLAVADEIISQHGGTLEIKSKEQQGTTVLIMLPSVEK
ncbi:MAG: HAMP domain-containing histidine kinase [Provencibacterium sp.]|nr:HAMP domain-containing histidine kinase [Provencibacterium sp.]